MDNKLRNFLTRSLKISRPAAAQIVEEVISLRSGASYKNKMRQFNQVFRYSTDYENFEELCIESIFWLNFGKYKNKNFVTEIGILFV